MKSKTTDSVQLIPLDRITGNARNPRRRAELKRSHPAMKELMTSIAGNGLLQPVLLRPIAGEDNRYELIAGERRFQAHVYLERDAIAAIVRERSDPEVATDLLVENLQRVDVDPILEAKLIASEVADGRTIEDIAARLGKSPAWTAKRSRITKLSRKWLAHIEESLPSWTIEHLVLIARYDAETQEQLLTDVGKQWNLDEASPERLGEHLATFFHDVTRTPWDAEDAELVPAAGACTTCTKRAGCQPSLFDDVLTAAGKGSDRCLDHACWDRKRLALLEQREAHLREAHPQLVRVSVES